MLAAARDEDDAEEEAAAAGAAGAATPPLLLADGAGAAVPPPAPRALRRARRIASAVPAGGTHSGNTEETDRYDEARIILWYTTAGFWELGARGRKARSH